MPPAPRTSAGVLHILFERCAEPLALLDERLAVERVNDALVTLLGDGQGERAARALGALLEDTAISVRLRRPLRSGVAELRIPLGGADGLIADAHPIRERSGVRGLLLAVRSLRPSPPGPLALRSLAAALSRAKTRAAVCDALLAAADAGGAAAGAVFFPAPDGRSLRMAAQRGYADPVVEMFRTVSLDEPLAAAEVFRCGEPLYLTTSGAGLPRELRHLAGLRPHDGPRAAAVVPLCADEVVLGVLAHSYEGTRAFAAAERASLELIGLLAGQALRAVDLEERAGLASRAKADFLGILSHEFRTPLSAILGYIDLLESGAGGERVSAAQAEKLERARRSTWHLTEMVDGMLQLARAEKGLEACQMRRIDVARLVRDAAELMEPPAREKGLTLAVGGADAPLLLTTDPAKLRQVLLNIIGNAVKFTTTGSVRVSLSTRRGWALIRVADTGPGVPVEQRPLVFDVFWQADQSDTRAAGGVGLGLTVARRLLDLLGGSVRIAANAGGGTRVVVRLPLEDAST